MAATDFLNWRPPLFFIGSRLMVVIKWRPSLYKGGYMPATWLSGRLITRSRRPLKWHCIRLPCGWHIVLWTRSFSSGWRLSIRDYKRPSERVWSTAYTIFVLKNRRILSIVMHLSMFCPTSAHAEKRGISYKPGDHTKILSPLANTKLLFSLITW